MFFKVFFVYIHYFCLSLKYGGKMMNIKRYNEIADKNKPQKQVLKHILSAFSWRNNWNDWRILF